MPNRREVLKQFGGAFSASLVSGIAAPAVFGGAAPAPIKIGQIGVGHAHAFSLVMGSAGLEKALQRYVLFVLVVSALYFLSAMLVLTDWLPAWGGWDDAVCLVFDGGTRAPSALDEVVKQEREIRDVRFCTLEEVDELAADFTARRVRAAVSGTHPYTESGR